MIRTKFARCYSNAPTARGKGTSTWPAPGSSCGPSRFVRFAGTACTAGQGSRTTESADADNDRGSRPYFFWQASKTVVEPANDPRYSFGTKQGGCLVKPREKLRFAIFKAAQNSDTVTAIAAKAGCARSTASYHLGILLTQGVLNLRESAGGRRYARGRRARQYETDAILPKNDRTARSGISPHAFRAHCVITQHHPPLPEVATPQAKASGVEGWSWREQSLGLRVTVQVVTRPKQGGCAVKFDIDRGLAVGPNEARLWEDKAKHATAALLDRLMKEHGWRVAKELTVVQRPHYACAAPGITPGIEVETRHGHLWSDRSNGIGELETNDRDLAVRLADLPGEQDEQNLRLEALETVQARNTDLGKALLRHVERLHHLASLQHKVVASLVYHPKATRLAPWGAAHLGIRGGRLA